MRQSSLDAQVSLQEFEQNFYKVQSELPARYEKLHGKQVSACVNCLYFEPHNDGTNKGWCGLFNHFARATHQQTQDCVNTIRDVEQEVQELPAPYEIDSQEHPEHGEVFRLWKGWEFAGSFYQARDGKWQCESVKAEINGSFSTPEKAILVLIAISENPQLQVA